VKSSINSFLEVSNLALSSVLDGEGAQVSNGTATSAGLLVGPKIATTATDFVIARYLQSSHSNRRNSRAVGLQDVLCLRAGRTPRELSTDVDRGEGRGEFLHGLGRLQDCRVRFHFTTRCQALGAGAALFTRILDRMESPENPSRICDRRSVA